MTTTKTEVSIGEKIGAVAIIVIFAAIGGFFGFLFDLTLRLSGIHDSTTRLISIIVGAALFSLIPLINLKRGANKERERIASSGGDSSGIDIFTLAILGSTMIGGDSGSDSSSGWFGGGSDSGGWSGSYGGGGDSGGGGGGGGGE
jgi:uncharacterized membrane protein YuzA (DUF378 family)